MAEIGRHLPPPGEEARKIIAADRRARLTRRLLRTGVVVLVLLLGAAAVAQWVRPVPGPSLQVPASVRLPGTPPTLPWPSTGEAAVTVEGLGSLGQVRGAQPVPIAGLVDVLTAYVVLRDHPLATDADGPSITVTPDTVSAFQAGSAQQLSEVPVTTGEILTEREVLEGLLVDSGSDMATLLADWDAGSTGAFLSKMGLSALALGMRSTHISDPSGTDPSTTSTAEDLVRLGTAAMSLPALRQIVSEGEATLPMTPVVYNLNFELGQDGIVGIKTGSDAAANGCYLFAAQQTVGGKQVTVVGAVLGQAGPEGPNTAAVDAGDALVKAAVSSVHAFALFSADQSVGALVTPWGSSAPVAVSAPVTVVGWPGLEVPLTTHLEARRAPLAAGARAGLLRAGVGADLVQEQLHSSGALSGPTTWWRLTR